MGLIEDNSGCHGGEIDKEMIQPIALDEVVARNAIAGAETTAIGDVEAERNEEVPRAASDKDSGNQHEIEAPYGRELSKARDKIVRRRTTQVKEAFRIGETWTELTKTLTQREVSAFLVSECQVPGAT